MFTHNGFANVQYFACVDIILPWLIVDCDVCTQQNMVEVIVQSALMWCMIRPWLIVAIMNNEFPRRCVDFTYLFFGRQELQCRDKALARKKRACSIVDCCFCFCFSTCRWRCPRWRFSPQQQHQRGLTLPDRQFKEAGVGDGDGRSGRCDGVLSWSVSSSSSLFSLSEIFLLVSSLSLLAKAKKQ